MHTFPLGADAAATIKISAKDRKGYIFPAGGSSPTPFSAWSKSKLALDKILKIPPWTLHDLRRTFATNLARLGVRLEVTEKLLNHISGSTGGIVGLYQRHDFKEEKREAIERYEAFLLNLFASS